MLLKSFSEDSSNCAARLTLSRFTRGRLGPGGSSQSELNIQSGSKTAFTVCFRGLFVSDALIEVELVVVLEILEDDLDEMDDILGA